MQLFPEAGKGWTASSPTKGRQVFSGQGPEEALLTLALSEGARGSDGRHLPERQDRRPPCLRGVCGGGFQGSLRSHRSSSSGGFELVLSPFGLVPRKGLSKWPVSRSLLKPPSWLSPRLPTWWASRTPTARLVSRASWIPSSLPVPTRQSRWPARTWWIQPAVHPRQCSPPQGYRGPRSELGGEPWEPSPSCKGFRVTPLRLPLALGQHWKWCLPALLPQTASAG